MKEREEAACVGRLEPDDRAGREGAREDEEAQGGGEVDALAQEPRTRAGFDRAAGEAATARKGAGGVGEGRVPPHLGRAGDGFGLRKAQRAARELGGVHGIEGAVVVGKLGVHRRSALPRTDRVRKTGLRANPFALPPNHVRVGPAAMQRTTSLVVLAAAFALTGCADRKELERTQSDVQALQMEVRRLQSELTQAQEAAAAARAALAEREERDRSLTTRFADVENRTRNLEQFNEAVFGRLREQTGQQIAEASQESRVRLDQVEFRFSRQLEDVAGQIATVATAQSEREREFDQLRDEVRRVLDQENQPPRLVRSVAPDYPRALRRSGTEGEVELVFLVDMAGNVVEPRVTSSTHDEFAEAALRAIAQWRFNPALINGRPSNSYVTQSITFKLNRD